MRLRLLISMLSLSLVTACASIESSHEILEALDTEADGYKGLYGSHSLEFTIRKSYVSDTKLCRVVVISADSLIGGPRTQIESFCKAKGGKWR